MNCELLILDGGFGTMLQTYDLGDSVTKAPGQAGGCNDYLSISRPDVVGDIHRRYLEAGADIISTNSFNANAISLADYGLSDQAYDIAKAAATVARQMADRYSTPERPRYVAGSMGPTNRTLSMSADVNMPANRDVTFEQMRAAYMDQARGLIDGGVDMLLIETAFDALNVKAAIHAIRSLSADIPMMISATVSDASGRLLTGQTIEAFCASVMHARPISLGLNCGCGARHLMPYIRQMAQTLPTMISVHPNAGLPNVSGGYDETPEMFAADIEAYMRDGLVNIVGGCCGTTPDHIRAIAELAHKYKARTIPLTDGYCTLSGLETLTFTPQTNFVNIGERTNVAGSAKFARMIRDGQYTEALEVAKAQVNAGAQIVDVCMDDAMIDGVQSMTTFVNLMESEPDVARVPLMIDSSKWEVVEAGLQCAQGKSIVNSISLKEGEEAFLDKARRVMSYGAAVVVMLFDEEGQADTYERKIAVARRAYDLLISIGFNPQDIIMDPNVLAVGTGIAEHDRYARDFIEATRWIKTNLPGAKVSGGVSNLSFSYRGNNMLRRAMHAVFLLHAIEAGMDMAIVNPQMVLMYDDIPADMLGYVEDLILYRRPDASDRLAEYAKTMMTPIDTNTQQQPVADQWRNDSVEHRIEYALVKGDTTYIADDALEAYHQCGSAIAVIDNMLMPAMARVGQLFGQGKMFLPQVVKSARAMKLAVAAIEPFIAVDNASGDRAKTKNSVVLATVKGDVHDIGKNIVGVVLACNGYDVQDLGVMVPADTIVDCAVECGAVAICLSGLITPSLDEMIRVAEAVERRGLRIPIIVGGATTTDIHTAMKIAPVTQAPVIHSRDAAHNASILSALTGDKADEYVAGVRLRQRLLVEDYERSRVNRTITPCACGCGVPAQLSHAYDTRTSIDIPLTDVVEHINWSYFTAAWGIPGRYPQILDHPVKGEEARRLMADARQVLDGIIADGSIQLRGVLQTFDARAEGDDIVLGTGVRLPMLRNEVTGACINDYIGDGCRLTLFALTSGVGLDKLTAKYRDAGDDYNAIMIKLLCDRLVEALADKLLSGGCRVAVGYPAMPDHSLKRDIFDILDVERDTQMRMTENYMIVPGESICGIYLPHGRFIDAGRPSAAAIDEYARRRGLPTQLIAKLI